MLHARSRFKLVYGVKSSLGGVCASIDKPCLTRSSSDSSHSSIASNSDAVTDSDVETASYFHDILCAHHSVNSPGNFAAGGAVQLPFPGFEIS